MDTKKRNTLCYLIVLGFIALTGLTGADAYSENLPAGYELYNPTGATYVQATSSDGKYRGLLNPNTRLWAYGQGAFIEQIHKPTKTLPGWQSQNPLLLTAFFKSYTFECKANDPRGPQPNFLAWGTIHVEWGFPPNGPSAFIQGMGSTQFWVRDNFGQRSLSLNYRTHIERLGAKLPWDLHPGSYNYLRIDILGKNSTLVPSFLLIDLSEVDHHDQTVGYYSNKQQPLGCRVEPVISTQIEPKDFGKFDWEGLYHPPRK